MIRNKYSQEFEEWMRLNSHLYSPRYLLKIAKQFGYDMSPHALQCFMQKRHIYHKHYNPNKSHPPIVRPIGSERIKDDGMVQVKVAPDRWEYKQRLIYQDYTGETLTSDDYIIFLDHDRTNFDPHNLARVSRRESSILSNQRIFSSDPEVTKTAINVARLIISGKEKMNDDR